MDDQYTKTILIPFRVRSGQFELLNGDALPAIRDGMVGHLVVAEYALGKPEDTARFNSSEHASVLPTESRLLAPIALDKGMPPELKEYVLPSQNDKSLGELPGAAYVEIELRQELFVQLRGSKPPRLAPAKCYIPALQENASSVNHAYTKISERFEPKRLSHTGNVFQKVLFHDGNFWKPLDVLRIRAESAALSRSKESPASR